METEIIDGKKVYKETSPNFHKNGGKREGSGRQKGVPNRVTTEFKETIRKLLEDNSENVSEWLKTVAESNPARALDLIGKLAEYAAPKLTRTEVVGDKDNPLQMGISVNFVNTPKDNGR